MTRIGTYTVKPNTVVRRGYEVAAWYDMIELDPGEYEVRGTRIGGQPIADGERPYWLKVSIPGTILESHTPTLFCGNIVGKGNDEARRGERTTYTIQTYPWGFDQFDSPFTFAPGWALEERTSGEGEHEHTYLHLERA